MRSEASREPVIRFDRGYEHERDNVRNSTFIPARPLAHGRHLAVALIVMLTACSARQTPSVTDGGAMSPTGARADAEKILNLASWGDYIAPDTVPNIERKTGIKVNYEIYDNNEVLEAKLMTGHTHYDVVVPTAGFFQP